MALCPETPAFEHSEGHNRLGISLADTSGRRSRVPRQ